MQLAIERSKNDVQIQEGYTVPTCKIYRPSIEDFAMPMEYIRSIAEEGAEYGIVKIVPPDGWNPPLGISLEENKIKFDTRKQKIHRLQEGKSYKDGREHTIKSYRQQANEYKEEWLKRKGLNPTQMNSKAYEKEYWKIVETSYEKIEVEYANDLDINIVGSGFQQRMHGNQISSTATMSEKEELDFSDPEYYQNTTWNLNNLPTADGSVLKHINAHINGVNVPWLYCGMLFATFCWHTEDNYMYSINYMHYGEPKHWYGVPASDAAKFEAAWKKNVPERFSEKPDLFFHVC